MLMEAIMDDLDQATPARAARGRWAPGQSGNPRGKAPGTKRWATRLRELLAEGADALAVQVVMDKVRAGDGVAARFLLDRLFPKPRDRDIELDLPAGASLAETFDRALDLMAAGALTIDDASRIAALIRTRIDRFGYRATAAAPAAAPAADTASPAFDLQTAGDGADRGADAAPRPLNRHERRRAAALERAARAPTPLAAVAA
jgi:hypothetical protein